MDPSPWWQWAVVLGAVVLAGGVVLRQMARSLGVGSASGRSAGGCGACASCPSAERSPSQQEGLVTLAPPTRPR